MTNKKDYGKLANGQIEYPLEIFVENGNSTIWYDEAFLLAQGYKPVVYSDCPEDVTAYDATYTDNGDSIVQTWTPQT